MVEGMLTSDKVCNGLFVVCVKTTGIYCLPTCRPSRLPKPENVEFAVSPEEARAMGYRARKLCKPDDFYRGHHPEEVLIEGLAADAARDPGAHRSVNALADAAGISLSRLHRLFRAHYHTTPADFLARLRVTAAQRLLLGTGRQIGEIAYEVGFESLSAFNENFQRYAALSPLKYRGMLSQPCFDLSLPAGYPTASVLKFLGRDPKSLSERVSGQTYTTAFRVGSAAQEETCVLVEIELTAEAAHCRLRPQSALSPAMLQQTHESLLKTLGLSYDIARFEKHIQRAAEFSLLAAEQTGLRVPLIADPFDGIAWAIIGQQINLAFAYTLRRRLMEKVCVRAGGDVYELPSAAAVAGLEPRDLTALQFSNAKAEYLIGAARLVTMGQLSSVSLGRMSAEHIERDLMNVRGIGPWSAHYIMMRCLGFMDCLPIGDTGLTTGLKRVFSLAERPGKAETIALMRRFSPYRTLATFHLWHSLSSTGE